MAQEKYAYGSNTGDLFADDDPLAELARIVGYDQPSTRARPAEPEFAPAPARPVAAARPEPVFDLEDELLQEFERYDAPTLDPVAAIPVEPAVADHWSARAEIAAPQLAPRTEPGFSGRFTENPVPLPTHARPATEPSAFAPRHEDYPAAPELPTLDDASFDVDLADELELAIAAANEDDAALAPVVEARAGAFQVQPADFQPARREPSFADETPPVFAEQPAQAYDVSHFDTEEIEEAISEAAFDLAPEPVAAAPARQEPDVAEVEEAVAEDEFELALDGLEIDLSDIVLNEVEAAVPAPAAEAPAAPKVEEPVWSEPVRALPETDFDGEMPFDASQIAEPDYGPEAIAELDVPEMPVHETEERKPYQPAFDTDFDAELADLIHDDRTVAAAVAKPAEAAQPPKPAAADLDDFSLMMNEDFRDEANNPLGLDRGSSRVVIDPDNMEIVEPEGRNRLRGWLLAAAASVGVLAAGGGLYAWLNTGGVAGLAGNGGPPIVLADAEPVKVVPENPGGKTVPNQDKAVYDRVAGATPQTPTQKSLISSSEEPLDVVQRTLTPENFPLERAEDEEMADDADQRLQPDAGAETAADKGADTNVSLRKVRTMIVRPDGTLVARDVPETAAPQQPETQTAAKLPASSSSAAPAATESAPLRTEQPAAAQPAASNEALSQAAASTVPGAQPAVSRPAAAPAASDRAPVPVQRPADQPVNVVGTVTGAGNVRPAAAPPQQVAAATPATTSAAVPAGTYVVQIASLPSQAEAEKSARTMSGKYGSVIGGRSLDIKAADIPGKGTFYRVRVVAGSKDEANALCTKLKAAGGSCLVTR